MKYRWLDKNIDLNSLVEAIENFLEMKKFETVRQDLEDSSRLLGTFRTKEGETRSVAVTISGDPNDFTVQLKTGQQMSLLQQFGFLPSLLFGAGSLLVRKQTSADFYRKLEEDFWRFLERNVSQLHDRSKLLS